MIKFRNFLENIGMKIYSRMIRGSFKSCGPVYVMPSTRIDNAKYITLEAGVTLLRNGWLYVIPNKSREETPSLLIKEGTRIHDHFHITAANKVTIGAYCLISNNVLITDSLHNYNDTTKPIIAQGITVGETSIGEGCFLGNNCAIVNSTIGKNCMIGANTLLVNQYIPDYSVVSGNPGKVIRTLKPKQQPNS